MDVQDPPTTISVTTAPVENEVRTAANLFGQTLLSSLKGSGSLELEKILDPKCTFKSNSPFGISNRQELMISAQNFAEFFSDPQIVVFDAKANDSNSILKLRCQLSFWYPLPWRPRIIIPLEVDLSINSNDLSNGQLSISHIEEKWEISPLEIFTKQMMPRWWDVWHVFVSPTPEYPPICRSVAATVDNVAFAELPETLVAEITWEGSSKFPGPPILSVPSFSLFGSLRTTRKNREGFSTVLPVEVQSSRFTSLASGEDRKRTVWVYHVPSHLQNVVLKDECFPSGFGVEWATPSIPIAREDDSDMSVDQEQQDEVEYQVGFDNLSLLKSVSAGQERGNLTISDELLNEFESKQKKSYRYRVLPKRLIAEVELKGEVESAQIAEALGKIRTVLKNSLVRGQRHRVAAGRFSSSDAGSSTKGIFGLQSWGTKVCFNKDAQPSMAIYEMQYTRQITKIFVEIEPDV